MEILQSVDGQSNGCGWNNSVAHNRIMDEIKASSATPSSFSELRLITKKAVGEDMKAWIQERKRVVTPFEAKYRITNAGLKIAGGGR